MNTTLQNDPRTLHDAPRDRIEADFWAFHLANPRIYEELRDLALNLKRQGRKHYGIKALYEVVRYHVVLNERSSADFICNNNYTAIYARLLMQNEPELRGFFRTRRRRATPFPSAA